jgi:phenylacetic acid degradation operon negative regulatory protein
MTHQASSVVAGLVARFRRQRPLRAGSLIVTIFGDSILPRGGAIALGSLIELAAQFGLNERLVRTASARLAQEGWLESRRLGKLSEYRLTTDGRAQFLDATQRIYGEADGAWSGRWTLIVVPALRGSQRKEVRKELIWAGFGEVSPGVFAHPELTLPPLRPQLRLSRLLSSVFHFEARLADDDASQRLVALGWDLKELGLRYNRFVERFEPIRACLQRRPPMDPQRCFIARTLLIHEYRRLHLRDPLLPSRLLPDEWPGTRAAALCRDIYARVFVASEIYLSDRAATIGGPLPSVDASVMQRFGGITLR